MTVISGVLAVPAWGAGYHEGLASPQAEGTPLPPQTGEAPHPSDLRTVREPAEAVSIGLCLEESVNDSRQARGIAWGDCVAVSHSGVAGRDPVFRSKAGLVTVGNVVGPAFAGTQLTSFRGLATKLEELTELVEVERIRPPAGGPSEEGGLSRRSLLSAPVRALYAARKGDEPGETVSVRRALHPGVRYGVSQALLQAVAMDRGLTMAEIIAEEWDLDVPANPVAIHAQSSSERYRTADRMIVWRVPSLPHGKVDCIADQVGADGSELTRYLRWLAGRIGELAGEEYRPAIYLDLSGALGAMYDNEPGRMLGQLYAWELAAQPYRLRIECPMLLESREDQIQAMASLRDLVRLRGMTVQLVAGEWANTLDDIHAFVEAGACDMIHIRMPGLGSVHKAVEAILTCKSAGVDSLLGGSCAETHLSATVSAHVALATQPDLLMAKPGVGVDEGVSLVHNEMARALEQIHWNRRGLNAL